MTFFTIRTGASFDGAAREAVETLPFLRGATLSWRQNEALGRGYAIVEFDSKEPDSTVLSDALPPGSKLYRGPVVALAVFPDQLEAVPALADALGGDGRPAGILSCERCDGGIIVEWNADVTSARTVLGLVDVELARWNSGRRCELLSALPVATIARIAADGLQAPSVAVDRVLETLLERADIQP